MHHQNNQQQKMCYSKSIGNVLSIDLRTNKGEYMSHPIMQCQNPTDIIEVALKHEFRYATRNNQPLACEGFLDDLIRGRIQFVKDPEVMYYLKQWFNQSIRHKVAYAAMVGVDVERAPSNEFFDAVGRLYEEGKLIEDPSKPPTYLYREELINELKELYAQNKQFFDDELTSNPEKVSDFIKNFMGLYGINGLYDKDGIRDMTFDMSDESLDKLMTLEDWGESYGRAYHYMTNPLEITEAGCQIALVNLLSFTNGDIMYGSHSSQTFSHGFGIMNAAHDAFFDKDNIQNVFTCVANFEGGEPYLHGAGLYGKFWNGNNAISWHFGLYQCCVHTAAQTVMKGDYCKTQEQVDNFFFRTPKNIVNRVWDSGYGIRVPLPSLELVREYDSIVPAIRTLELGALEAGDGFRVDIPATINSMEGAWDRVAERNDFDLVFHIAYCPYYSEQEKKVVWPDPEVFVIETPFEDFDVWKFIAQTSAWTFEGGESDLWIPW